MITAVTRPFVLTFRGSGHEYPLSCEEAQRLLDSMPIVSATPFRVVLQGNNANEWFALTPATLGGGPAFIIEKEKP